LQYLAVRPADHHLDKIGCAAGDGDNELVSAERCHHIGLDLRRPATGHAEQINVLRRACAHTVELDRMTSSQHEATVAHRIQSDPGQPFLERIHHTWRSSGKRSSHSART
jgi:hypothetical protein